MPSVTRDNFGPLIAYLVPGATALAGISQLSPVVRSWWAAAPSDTPTIGGFLYLTVASLAVGMTVTAIRWALIDLVHSLTGLKMPALDFSKLGANVQAFNLLIEIHYRHYQYYANMFIAVLIAYVCYRTKIGGHSPLGWIDAGFVALEAIFFVTSRDTLRKYYFRSGQLLSGRRSAVRRIS